MVKSAASLARERERGAVVRWRVSLAAFLLVNGLAYRTPHFWLCLGATSTLMVCAFGFRGRADDDRDFVSGGARELSAYSVFNKDFRELPGTLNAAGVDRQIRSGGVSGDSGVQGRDDGHRWGKGNKLR